MKVLYACRLFTGLEHSLYSKNWMPTGVPTIYKIMETLDKASNVCFILTRKDDGKGAFSTWFEHNDQVISINGMNHPFHVLTGDDYFPSWLHGKIRGLLRELRQTIQIFRHVRDFKPDIIYVDHANTLAAGMLARFSGIPVIYRVMGVYPSMREMMNRQDLWSKIIRWSYRAPFSLMICSQDGSGAEKWIDQALTGTADKRLLINGMTLPQSVSISNEILLKIPNDKIVVMFLGKMETYKGCDDFVAAILALEENYKNQIHVLMVGIGNRTKVLKQAVVNADMQSHFTFIDRLPHGEVLEAHRRADIYVSLNRYGNLSNANLEAMSVGACMIIPSSDEETGVDIVTDKLIDDDAVVRLPRDDLVDGLVAAIEELCDSPVKRETLSNNVAKQAEKFIPTWKQRIVTEVKLLEDLANSKG